ncbi:MAG: sensor histidine kinase [Bacteroidetes bacterium]|nr:sensor histidine kinase [Bacteroidota bacterium]
MNRAPVSKFSLFWFLAGLFLFGSCTRPNGEGQGAGAVDTLGLMVLRDSLSASIDGSRYKAATDFANTYLHLSDSLGIYRHKVLSLRLMTRLFAGKNEYPHALTSLRQLALLAKEASDTLVWATSMKEIVQCYKELQYIDSALAYSDSTLALLKGKQNHVYMELQLLLGSIYDGQGYYHKGMQAIRTVLKWSVDKKRDKMVIQTKLALASMFGVRGVLDSAEMEINSLLYGSLMLNPSDQAHILSMLGAVYGAQGKLPEAAATLKQARQLVEMTKDWETIGVVLTNLSNLQVLQGRYQDAVRSMRKVYMDTLVNKGLRYDLANNIAHTYEKMGQLDSAMFFLKERLRLAGHIKSGDLDRMVVEYENKFAKQRLKNDKMRLEKVGLKAQNKSRWMVAISLALSALMLSAALLALLFWQRYRNRKIINEQNEVIHRKKLEELVRENKMERVRALVEGQEQERTRISAELHDGLGSLLSTVKHHFEVLTNKHNGEQVALFEKVHHMLDDACVEVRKISHDMASNVLGKFGLKAALYDLSDMVSASGSIQVKMAINGLESKLDKSLETHIFRLVQELLANTVKHAHATKVNVQVLQFDDNLSIVFEDNGRGFDYDVAKKKDGLGLKNILTRVAHLQGTVEFDTGKGSGTTVLVDIPLSQEA